MCHLVLPVDFAGTLDLSTFSANPWKCINSELAPQRLLLFKAGEMLSPRLPLTKSAKRRLLTAKVPRALQGCTHSPHIQHSIFLCTLSHFISDRLVVSETHRNFRYQFCVVLENSRSSLFGVLKRDEVCLNHPLPRTRKCNMFIILVLFCFCLWVLRRDIN